MGKEMTFGELAEWGDKAREAAGATAVTVQHYVGNPDNPFNMEMVFRNGDRPSWFGSSPGDLKETAAKWIAEWFVKKEQDHARLGAELAATRKLLGL